MSAFPPAPKPPTLLGYHRLLSPTAGVRVSPLCLGAMNFGESWKGFLGECSKETTFEMLDFFWEAGGNFIDTANNYQNEESETWIGEWMASRQNRDEMVLATKFTTGYRTYSDQHTIKANFQGNHNKSIRLSVEASLKKLQTTYIDLLYLRTYTGQRWGFISRDFHMIYHLHAPSFYLMRPADRVAPEDWWDFTTSIPELMQSLHHLVAAGKVLYLGISDTPAWIVVKCNDYARFHGLTQFSVYQGHWSAAKRDFERDILGMVESEGMALAPWGALGRGWFKSREAYASRDDGRKMGEQPENYVRVAGVLEDIAKQKGEGTLITSVALAYVMHKAPYVFPIVGGRKVEHLKGNIDALGLELTQEDIDAIEAAEPFDVGWPMNFLFGYGGRQYKSHFTASDMPLVTTTTRLETVPKVSPIEARQGEKRGKREGIDK